VVETPGIDGQLRDLRLRLHREYDDRVDPDEVERAIVDCSRDFGGARITTYLAVLVEKQVRDRLRSRRLSPTG
jgi:hypothetical protein